MKVPRKTISQPRRVPGAGFSRRGVLCPIYPTPQSQGFARVSGCHPTEYQPRRAGGALLAEGGSSERAGRSKPHSFQFAKNGRSQLLSNAQRWVKLDPLHEPAQHQLIALYLTNAQRAEAYRQYQGFVCLLFEELGVEPQPETKALYEAMRKGRAPGLAESPSIFEQEIKIFSSFDGARVRNHTLIRYDERGCGLSDWEVGKISFEAWVQDPRIGNLFS